MHRPLAEIIDEKDCYESVVKQLGDVCELDYYVLQVEILWVFGCPLSHSIWASGNLMISELNLQKVWAISLFLILDQVRIHTKIIKFKYYDNRCEILQKVNQIARFIQFGGKYDHKWETFSEYNQPESQNNQDYYVVKHV